MMRNKRDFFWAIGFSIFFTLLFHRQAPGLNLLIAEIALFLWLLISGKYSLKGLYPLVLGIGLVLSSIFTVVTHSVFSYVLNYMVLFVFIGLLIYPETKSILFAVGQAFANLLDSQRNFFRSLSGSNYPGQKPGRFLRRISVFIVPLFIALFFLVIYRKSNPIFDDLMADVSLFFQDNLGYIFKDFDFLLILSFVLSLIFSVFVFFRRPNQSLLSMDLQSNEFLCRVRRKRIFKPSFYALKNEYKAGVFLFVVLNTVLLVLNIIDIKWVWFGFEWEGQYLKQFVHEGTYLLILSVIISIFLVLYYFRRNLNFYPNNRCLKYLSYLWLFQNGILTLSVAIRNLWYIHYFALAYKRIGVFIFLIMTLYGLYTVYKKVYEKRSLFYVLRNNSFFILMVLVISSFVPWDGVIARYNFSHSNQSFVHLDYLSTLSDQSLPCLEKPLSELKRIEIRQKQLFPFEQKYMTPEEYHRIICRRKARFIEEWPSKSILSWNLPEYLAYKKLTQQGCATP